MTTLTHASDQLSETFSALSDPTRRAMLVRLSKGETSVKELAKPFKLSAPAITKHLKVLERCGLIKRRHEAQWRHCIIQPKPLKQAVDWLEEYKQLWEDRLDRLEAYLAKA